MDEEQQLAGGNAGGSVVRIAGTVRKAWVPSTPSVVAFVEALRSAGVDAPAPLGRDEQGRQVQEFVPGPLAHDLDSLSRAELRRVGELVRGIHEAATGYVPSPAAVWDSAIAAPGAELICHHDLAPWNLVMGERWVFIDWDAAAPGTRAWDLAYSAQTFTLNDVTRPPREAAADLAAFVDGYGAQGALREHLPATMAQRTAAMRELLESSRRRGVEPWASMHDEGHGDHWRGAELYVREHAPVWAAALA